MDFTAPSKRLPSPRIDPHRSASLGIRSRVCPTSDKTSTRPLPEDVATSVRPAVTKRPVLFRPRGFSPPRRLTPRPGPECIATRAGQDSLRFTLSLPTQSLDKSMDRSGNPTRLPATRFTPFEEYPSSVAVPHHCGRCLPAVTSPASLAEAEASANTQADHKSPPAILSKCRNTGFNH